MIRNISYFVDGDLITIHDSSDLMFAKSLNRYLKLTLFGEYFFPFDNSNPSREVKIAEICKLSQVL